MKYYVILALCFFLIFRVYAQPANTNISNGLLFDGEPYLALNPVNPQNLVAAWMGLKLSGGQLHVEIRTRSSFNGGTTWSSVKTLPHFASTYGSADVSMAFDKSGTLYIAYIDYRQVPDSGGIYVARSYDGGLNWDMPSKAFDMYDDANKRPIDRPWLVVDNSNTSNSGTLYITTKPAPWISPPNRNYYKVSTDSGRTWTAIRNVDGGTHLVGNNLSAPMAAPATTIDGNFCAVYPSFVPSQNPLPAYYMAISSDKGNTFSYTTVFAAIPAASDTNYKSGYQLITNPTDGNKLVFLMIDARQGDADIIAYQSSNKGVTWSGPVRVNDDAVGNGKAQDMVWGSYNESGKLVVSWRDRRNASVNGFWNAGYEFYYAISPDNGQTFSKNQLLSSLFIPFDSLLTENGNDFMSNAFFGDTVYATWGDTRNGKMNIYFSKTIASTGSNVVFEMLDGNAPAWNIFPNPAKNILTITSSSQIMGKIFRIFDVTGHNVRSGQLGQSMNIDVGNLDKGIYFIELENSLKKFIRD